MTIDTNDILSSILDSLSRIDYVHAKDIPDIDLYMDQVTTFMEGQLSSTKRYKEDKILTKTMINNYAKNHLLPAPEKKKYSRDHLLVLIFIYYFKNILSIKDISSILGPVTEKYFHSDSGYDLTYIYEEICRTEKAQIEPTKEAISRLYQLSEESFEALPDEEREYMKLFSFICSLSFDVYVKKLLIEKLIDQLPDPAAKKKP